MPVPLTYPGVYIEELKSGVRTITGVSTAVTAFVGRARMGPAGEPATMIHSFLDYERKFGGLWDKSPMSFAVQQYFLNGGRDALIVRAFTAASGTNTTAKFRPTGFVLDAASPGVWANGLWVEIDLASKDPLKYFNLTVWSSDPNPNAPIKAVALETVRNLSTSPAEPSFVKTVLEQQSQYVRAIQWPMGLPTADKKGVANTATDLGIDGGDLSGQDLIGTPSSRTGIYALDTADIFNILCLPPPKEGVEVGPTNYATAATYCEARRAMLLVDVPVGTVDATSAKSWVTTTLALPSKNAAVFFPRVKFANPLKDNLLENFAPCGAMAGVFARTDSERGVWKAPAGIEANIVGAAGLSVSLTDAENGDLNPVAVNCLRTFPVYGTVAWGSRTLVGADVRGDEWKYIPVRRTALYLEESLFRGLKWVVFEPNDEPLWSQIRLNVGSFMHSLFRQGAFQGKSPREAYFVKCDGETTTQADIDRGIVNILVGFAPLKPAEFVVIKIQQIAGQLEV